jgi:hypothetical protein
MRTPAIVACLISQQVHATLPPSTREILAATFARIPLSNKEFENIKSCHNAVVGHGGVERTLRLLKSSRRAWVLMEDAVKQFIRECPICQKMSQIKPAIKAAKFVQEHSEPMKYISMDTIGPLPVDEDGNKYILVMIDNFSRFIDLHSTKTVEALPAAKAVLQHIGRFGAPEAILSDNGTQFANETLNELIRILQGKHIKILAYSHEENGLVERANKEIMRHLRAILLENEVLRSNWSAALPLVQRIMNSTRHESIGVAPSKIIFGHAINLDRGLFETDSSSQHATLTSSVEWVDKMLKLQLEVIQSVKDTQARTDMKHLYRNSAAERELLLENQPEDVIVRTVKTKAAKTPIVEFAIGDFVLIDYPDSGLGKRPPNKLMTPLKGPMQVIGHKGSTYTLRNLVSMKTEDVFIGRLRPFHYDQARTAPRNTALQETGLYDVEEILDHRGNPKGSKIQLFFKVKWLGYDHTEDSWEPWSSLHKNAKLHLYLTAHNLTYLVPKGFRPTPA